ncbi:MAG: hypothetical protein FWG99_06245 [Treponema sp.]|nr:hypothetical protein [Treponema sp.]
MKKFFCYAIFLALLPVLSLSAWDWGLLLDQSAGAESVSDDAGPSEGFSYSAALIPWYSTPLGDAGKLYLSIGTSVEYENEDAAFVPQLLRTEFSYSMGNGGEIKAGRMLYADPLGFIAGGLFDGLRYSHESGIGTFGAGAWYTGLLYKRSAQITMTGDDLISFNEKFEFENFGDTYFASRRFIAAVDWNNSNITSRPALGLAFIGQFDLNDSDNIYHSQYLAARAGVPVNSFIFDLGFCLQLSEITEKDAAQKFRAAVAGELGASWLLPTAVRDRLTLKGVFSGGTPDDDSAFAAFVPVTTSPQGGVLKAKLSGLSVISLDYTVRPHESFLFSFVYSYFTLSDLGTYQGIPLERDGHILGGEFYGSLAWAPFSDLRLNLGGGVFLPSMGNASPKGDPLWRVELGAILVIF